MREREPMIQTLKFTEARQQFSQVVNRVFKREARVIVEKSGIPVAAIISAQDLERMMAWEAEREEDFAILDEIGEAFKDVPDEEVEREVARALSQVRQEQRKRGRRAATG